MSYKDDDSCLARQKSSSSINVVVTCGTPEEMVYFRTIFEAENTIRGQHGVTDARNCSHRSDSHSHNIDELRFSFDVK
jgi:hypothetical protein